MAYKPKEKVGIVVKFDMERQFDRIGDAATGRLVRAMLKYGRDKTKPDFSDDERLEMLWFGCESWLDSNDDHWSERSAKTAYAGWISSLKSAGKEYLTIPLDDWIDARRYYDEYCASRPQGVSPPLFNDWLKDKRDSDEKKYAAENEPLPF